jgi:hypothetical protein
MSFADCQRAWIGKFEEMRKADIDLELAAPFLSVLDGLQQPTGAGSVLLVGKATDKDWRLGDFLLASRRSTEERIQERRAATRDHLASERRRQTSAFWRFWRSLHEVGSPVIWTNLAKIGVTRGNPGHKHLTAQATLACQTLNAEVAEYRPSLIVIAGDYARFEIVHPVFGGRAAWREPDDFEFCWIERKGPAPAVLWTDHPERKLKARVERWLEKSAELV